MLGTCILCIDGKRPSAQSTSLGGSHKRIFAQAKIGAPRRRSCRGGRSPGAAKQSKHASVWCCARPPACEVARPGRGARRRTQVRRACETRSYNAACASRWASAARRAPLLSRRHGVQPSQATAPRVQRGVRSACGWCVSGIAQLFHGETLW